MYSKNNDKAKQFTRGGQITFHNLRMLLQINKTVWNIYLFSLVVLLILSIYIITPIEVLWSAWYWCLAQINPILDLLGIKLGQFAVPYHGKVYHISPKSFLSYKLLVRNAGAIIPYIKIGAGIGFVLSIGVFYGIIRWLISQGEKQTANQFIRGSRLDTPENVARLIKKEKMASDIFIDDMPIIVGSETKHFLVHGSTGAGKTQLISKLLDRLRKRGDRVFLYDKGGVYTSTFYRKDKDKILNPFDSRCENWNLWHEARTATDFENMAESLIPMHGETEPFWVNAARTIFGSAAFTMQDEGDRSIKKLLKLLLTSELHDLHSYLANTEAATLASDKIEKTAISIRSVITTYLKSLRFLTGIEQTKKPKFCIRDWVCDENDDGWLFLSSNAAQHASLKPLLSMWFSMATITLLALPENRNRRIWFICDELPSLHKLPQLPESIAEARKYGGCFVLGMQSYAQLEKVYGKSAGREIFDLMNTSFFFRSPSPDMADLVSRALGSQEIEDMRENYSYGANTIRDGISIGSQRVISQIVSASEIMDLEDMKCYLRLAGSYPITLLDLILNKRPQIAEGFILNEAKPDKEIEGLVESFDSNVRRFQVKKMKDVATKETVWQKAIKSDSNDIGDTDDGDDSDYPDSITGFDHKQEIVLEE
ncbi:MAG: type IV conjugative transfer system coupling protein TraD [Gammaproteobacteria bacterium]|nr:type IV conjugative transfer system coupling protein TraD [Gammaproteobacteria bacterium]